MEKGKGMLIAAIVMLVVAVGLGVMTVDYYIVMQDYSSIIDGNLKNAEDAAKAGDLEKAAKYTNYWSMNRDDYDANKTSSMAFGGGTVVSLLISGVLFAKRKQE